MTDTKKTLVERLRERSAFRRNLAPMIDDNNADAKLLEEAATELSLLSSTVGVTGEAIAVINALLPFMDLDKSSRRFDKIMQLEARASAVIAALESPSPKGWQPIETAPKDGTWIIAWYAGSKIMQPTYWGFPNGSDEEWWCEFDGDSVSAPSHWMSLPTPPLPASPQDKGEA